MCVFRGTRPTLSFLPWPKNVWLQNPHSAFPVCFNKYPCCLILHIHTVLRLGLSQEDADNAQYFTLYRFKLTLRLALHIYSVPRIYCFQNKINSLYRPRDPISFSSVTGTTHIDFLFWPDMKYNLKTSFMIWAAARQNQQNDLCSQRRPRSAWASTQSDQSLLPAWRNLGSLAIHWAHSKDWSDWVDAQADLSLRWAHWSFCWFCHAAAHLISCSFFGQVSIRGHIFSFENTVLVYIEIYVVHSATPYQAITMY